MKSRVTITLEESILQKIDDYIDGQTIRNRSHAIEFLLDQHFSPQVTTAIILAGGIDSTESDFRSLILMDNKPLIVHIVEHLQKFGISKVIIATNVWGHKLEELLPTFFDDSDNIEFSFVYEETPLGTAGAVKKAAESIREESFLVWSGDVYTTIDISDLLKFHLEQHALVSMGVKPRLSKASYDSVFIQGHTVVDFQKSKPEQEVSLVNAGVYVFSRSALEFIPPTVPAMLEQDVFPQLAKSQKLVAFPFQGLWMEVSPEVVLEKIA